MATWGKQRPKELRRAMSIVLAVLLLLSGWARSLPALSASNPVHALEVASLHCGSGVPGQERDWPGPATGHEHDHCCCLPGASHALKAPLAIVPIAVVMVAVAGGRVSYSNTAAPASRPCWAALTRARGPPLLV
jgi:hypothetical protein